MKKTLTALAILAAGTALAHQGVSNSVVMARMQGMSELKDAMEPLAAMAKGQQAFDADLAADARLTLIEHARAIPNRFSENATDPKSEALPNIWTDKAGFATAAAAALAASEALDVGTLEGLRASLVRVGAGCADCHDSYRK